MYIKCKRYPRHLLPKAQISVLTGSRLSEMLLDRNSVYKSSELRLFRLPRPNRPQPLLPFPPTGKPFAVLAAVQSAGEPAEGKGKLHGGGPHMEAHREFRVSGSGNRRCRCLTSFWPRRDVPHSTVVALAHAKDVGRARVAAPGGYAECAPCVDIPAGGGVDDDSLDRGSSNGRC
mgnify:FL=1